MYESVAFWRDLEDGHLYKVGEKFPHDGREVSEERIAFLLSTQNKAGFAVIRAVDVPVEGKPQTEVKTPKKTVKSRKKAE